MNDDERQEYIYNFCFSVFGLDSKTSINKRLDYSHNFFFEFRSLSNFLLSVYNHWQNKGFISLRQKEAIFKIFRNDTDNIIKAFPNNISIPSYVSMIAYGIKEGKEYSNKFYNENGGRKK